MNTSFHDLYNWMLLSPLILLFVKHCYLKMVSIPLMFAYVKRHWLSFGATSLGSIQFISFHDWSVILKYLLSSHHWIVYIDIFAASVHFDIPIRDFKYYSHLEGSCQFNFISSKCLKEGKDQVFRSWSSIHFFLFTIWIANKILWSVRYWNYRHLLSDIWCHW